jgi:hypothetical protein
VKPVGVYIAFNHWDAPFSRIIEHMTHPAALWPPWGKDVSGVPSHARIGLIYDNGAQKFWESMEGKGWRGPRAEARVAEEVARRPMRRWTRLYDVTRLMGEDGPEEVARRCEDQLGVWTYATRVQMVRLCLHVRRGIVVPKRSPEQVHCSEAVIRILDGDPDVGEHPILPRGWHGADAEASTPMSLLVDVERLVWRGARPI